MKWPSWRRRRCTSSSHRSGSSSNTRRPHRACRRSSALSEAPKNDALCPESAREMTGRSRKKPRKTGAFSYLPPSRLALGELERPAGLPLAVLLALDHARVARKEAAFLEHAAQLGLVVGEGARQAMAQRAGLTGEPTARYGRADIELPRAIGRHDGLLHNH